MYTLPVPHAWAEMPLFPHMLVFLVYWQEIHIHGQALLYMLFLFLCLFLSFLADPCLPRLLPLLVILIVHPLGFISRPRWIFKEVGSWQFMVNRLSLDTSASVGVLPLFTKDVCSAWAGFRGLTQIQLKTQKHHSLSLNMQLDKDIVGNSKQMPILTTMYPSNCSMICGTWSKFITKVNWSLGGGSQGQVPQQQGNIYTRHPSLAWSAESVLAHRPSQGFSLQTEHTATAGPRIIIIIV